MSIQQLNLSYHNDSEKIEEQEVKEAVEDFYTIRSWTKVVKTKSPDTLIYVRKVGRDYNIWVTKNKKPVATVSFLYHAFPDYKPTTFEPHAFVLKEHRGQGIVSSLYVWFLDAGNSLCSFSHTKGASKVWNKLAKRYREQWYSPKDKSLVEPYNTHAWRILLGQN